MISNTREAEVWQRVLAASGEAPKPAYGSLTPARVLQLREDELRDAHTYRSLAGRAPRDIRQSLLRLSEEERQHARQLEAVSYVMTGKRPAAGRPDAPAVPNGGNLNEDLRSRYREETAGAAEYRRLAEQADSFAPLFRELGDDEERHAGTILRLLQRTL